MYVKIFGEGVAVYAGPDSPANKIIGIGFDRSLDTATLSEIAREYLERGDPVQAEVATLADSAVHALLTARGYRLQGFENVPVVLVKTRDADRFS